MKKKNLIPFFKKAANQQLPLDECKNYVYKDMVLDDLRPGKTPVEIISAHFERIGNEVSFLVDIAYLDESQADGKVVIKTGSIPVSKKNIGRILF